MNAKSFHLSVQGASHIKKNKECQDASSSYYDDNCVIAVICDGHGGSDYMRSAFGSKFASEVTLENIKSFMNNIKAEDMRINSAGLIKQLESSIISDWNEAIYNHYNSNPFTDEELASISEKARIKYTEAGRIESAYGTTVIAVAMTDEFWIGIQIGDGKCVAVNPEGKFMQPIPWDSKCFLNATTSICDSHALENFRSFYAEKLPIAVFVGSDGIDDSFKNDEQLNNLYRTVLYSFMTDEFENAVNGLNEYLPRLSAKGSGDDMSISAIIDLDKISTIESVREFDKEKEKAKVDAAKKAEQEQAEAERLRVIKERKLEFRNQTDRISGEIECPVCGFVSGRDAKYCSNCGRDLKQVEVESCEVAQEEISHSVGNECTFDTEAVDNGIAETVLETENASETTVACSDGYESELNCDTADNTPDNDKELSISNMDNADMNEIQEYEHDDIIHKEIGPQDSSESTAIIDGEIV